MAQCLNPTYPDRCETKFCAGKCKKFLGISHIRPNRDQNVVPTCLPNCLNSPVLSPVRDLGERAGVAGDGRGGRGGGSGGGGRGGGGRHARQPLPHPPQGSGVTCKATPPGPSPDHSGRERSKREDPFSHAVTLLRRVGGFTVLRPCRRPMGKY